MKMNQPKKERRTIFIKRKASNTINTTKMTYLTLLFILPLLCNGAIIMPSMFSFEPPTGITS